MQEREWEEFHFILSTFRVSVGLCSCWWNISFMWRGVLGGEDELGLILLLILHSSVMLLLCHSKWMYHTNICCSKLVKFNGILLFLPRFIYFICFIYLKANKGGVDCMGLKVHFMSQPEADAAYLSFSLCYVPLNVFQCFIFQRRKKMLLKCVLEFLISVAVFECALL